MRKISKLKNGDLKFYYEHAKFGRYEIADFHIIIKRSGSSVVVYISRPHIHAGRRKHKIVKNYYFFCVGPVVNQDKIKSLFLANRIEELYMFIYDLVCTCKISSALNPALTGSKSSNLNNTPVCHFCTLTSPNLTYIADADVHLCHTCLSYNYTADFLQYPRSGIIKCNICGKWRPKFTKCRSTSYCH